MLCFNKKKKKSWSSLPEIFCKKALQNILRNFTKCHLCWSLFLTNLQIATFFLWVCLWIFLWILFFFFIEQLRVTAPASEEETNEFLHICWSQIPLIRNIMDVYRQKLAVSDYMTDVLWSEIVKITFNFLWVDSK